MNILVCMKQTFDTEEKIAIENGKVSEQGVNFIINPYDEYAIEEAIRLKEENGGEVTVVTVGPDRAEEALRKALAMGADKGVHINQEGLTDEFMISKAMAEVIRNNGFDIVLAGNFAVDSGAGQVAIRIAEELDIPHIGSITKLEIKDGAVTAHRDAEGNMETVSCRLPALVTAQQGLNEPRYPSLPGIMKAKKKPVERIEAVQLQVYSSLSSKVSVIKQFLPPTKKQGRILEGEIGQQVKELVEQLCHSDKVV